MPHFITSTWFVLTPAHIALLRHLKIVQYNAGGFGVDWVRPFGNSDIEEDIKEILVLADCDEITVGEAQSTEYNALYEEMAFAMQIAFQTGEIRPGVYYREDFVCDDWKRFPLETPLTCLSSLAREILIIILDVTKKHSISYLAEWNIADVLGVSHGEFSTKLPNTKYDRAIDELLKAGLIAELPDLHYRYYLVGLPEKDKE